jgi:uncharacterized protein
MSTDLLAEVTRQLIAAQPGNEVNITWQGGEPTLMGLALFEEAVRLQKQLAPPGVRVVNALQTNGTLLNPAWCRFFKENDFLVGLSIDGPPDAHNAYRRTQSGRERYESVLRAARLLAQHEVDHNVLCCVHQANVHQPLAAYRFLRDRVGARHIQFIPILQRVLDETGQETNELTPLSVDAAAYGSFLIAVFDEWRHHDIGRVFIQHFEVALGRYMGGPPGLCIFAETCGRALALEHNGDLYACDHFVDQEHLLGNVIQTPLADLVESEAQAQFGTAKRDNLPQQCLACDVRFLCNGGCPKNRDESGLNHLCAGYQAFFHHIDRPMHMMASLLHQKRSPAEIMQMKV